MNLPLDISSVYDAPPSITIKPMQFAWVTLAGSVRLESFFRESSLLDLQFCLQEAFSCGAVPVLMLSHNVSIQSLIKFALL